MHPLPSKIANEDRIQGAAWAAFMAKQKRRVHYNCKQNGSNSQPSTMSHYLCQDIGYCFHVLRYAIECRNPHAGCRVFATNIFQKYAKKQVEGGDIQTQSHADLQNLLITVKAVWTSTTLENEVCTPTTRTRNPACTFYRRSRSGYSSRHLAQCLLRTGIV